MRITVPPAECELNVSIVRSLIESQFPQLADMDIVFLDSGWDNENYRLGTNYIIRLPRRTAAVPLLENEITWLPKIKTALPIDIPAPIHIGVEERIKRLKDSNLIKDDRILEFWNRAVQESVPSNQCLIHGDMHPRNIVIDNGVLNAVIDWGDITTGDVATDLSSIWMLFEDPKVRGIGFKHYGADESTIRRAQGWAIFSGTLFLDLGLSSNGEYRRSGKQILKNVLS